jgi:hypothetical protein
VGSEYIAIARVYLAMSRYERFCHPRRLNSASVVGGYPLSWHSRMLVHEKQGSVLEYVSLKLQFVLAHMRPVHSHDTHSFRDDWAARWNPFVYGPALLVANAGHISYRHVFATVRIRKGDEGNWRCTTQPISTLRMGFGSVFH